MKFLILDHEYPSFGPPGCSGDNILAFRSAADIIQQTVLRLHLRKEDDTAFSQPNLMRLFVGMGPTCPNPPNVPKTTKAVVVNQIEQTIDLTINPYDAPWPPDLVKEFWIGDDEGGFVSWRASGTVSIQKICAP